MVDDSSKILLHPKSLNSVKIAYEYRILERISIAAHHLVNVTETFWLTDVVPN